MVHHQTTDQRKAELTNLLATSTATAPLREDLRIETIPDPLDQVLSSADRDIAIARWEEHSQRLFEIRAALAKIEKGQYGLCEECDEPIAARRLDVVPWARLCVRCQHLAEQHRHNKVKSSSVEEAA